MNKGRNIMILMCCLLLLGLLTFLARTKANNYSAVVDDVRYIMKGAEDNVKNYEFYFKDDKVNYASFALTRPTSQISVLIECGYIIRKEEADKISNKKFQKVIAKAITLRRSLQKKLRKWKQTSM